MRPLVEACVKVRASNLFFIELWGRFGLNESIYKSASRKKNANRVTLMFNKNEMTDVQLKLLPVPV